MLPDYKDIVSRIPDEPLWYDVHGVPRYEPFHRQMLGVYDHYSLYVLIACQACGQRFSVGVGWTRENWEAVVAGDEDNFFNDLEWLSKHFHYGDPPRHGGCSGETMNCEDIYILEAWDEETRRYDLEGLMM